MRSNQASLGRLGLDFCDLDANGTAALEGESFIGLDFTKKARNPRFGFDIGEETFPARVPAREEEGTVSG